MFCEGLHQSFFDIEIETEQFFRPQHVQQFGREVRIVHQFADGDGMQNLLPVF